LKFETFLFGGSSDGGAFLGKSSHPSLDCSKGDKGGIRVVLVDGGDSDDDDGDCTRIGSCCGITVSSSVSSF
jgi:hypothetical protein